MCWDSLSDAGRPGGDGASRFGKRRGLLDGQLLLGQRAVLSTRCCSRRPGRPRFEVTLLEIHTVKIYKKSVECAECLALPYRIVGMSENIQDFW